MKKTKTVISQRDEELLLFLWRHRVSTFQTLKSLFFPNTGNETVYNRLRKLRSVDYVSTDFIEHKGKTVWCLGERGFRFLDSYRLPELKTKGFRPKNRYHDLLVMSALLGDWYKKLPDGVDIVTDQELLTCEPGCLPAKLYSQFKHRPDGIWVKPHGREISAVGLEVEINAKAESRYEDICSFYGGFHFIEYVIWVVPERSLAKKILRIAAAGALPREGHHLFILLEDFEKHIWSARFINSSMKDVTMAEFLHKKLNQPFRSPIESRIETPVEHHAVEGCRSINSPLLNFSLSIERLNAYRKSAQANYS
jgi:hypothetical protein